MIRRPPRSTRTDTLFPTRRSSDLPGAAVHATRTLQFLGAHAGLATGAALDHVGMRELAALDVGDDALPADAAAAEMLDVGDLGRFLRPRSRNPHKGESGRWPCVGGGPGSKSETPPVGTE